MFVHERLWRSKRHKLSKSLGRKPNELNSGYLVIAISKRVVSTSATSGRLHLSLRERFTLEFWNPRAFKCLDCIHRLACHLSGMSEAAAKKGRGRTTQRKYTSKACDECRRRRAKVRSEGWILSWSYVLLCSQIADTRAVWRTSSIMFSLYLSQCLLPLFRPE